MSLKANISTNRLYLTKHAIALLREKVKYPKECHTVVLIDYGNGTCDNLAIKTICHNGKCELSAGAFTQEIIIDCKQDVIDGPISEAEALRMGI